jgi:hypothetical protein
MNIANRLEVTNGHADGVNGHHPAAADPIPWPTIAGEVITLPAVDARRAVVRAAVLAMAAAAPVRDGLRVVITCADSRLVYAVPAEEVAGLVSPRLAGLQRRERQLHSFLTDRPQSAKRIAAAAGYKMGSHIYESLRRLESFGFCRRTAKGYVRDVAPPEGRRS